MAPLRIELFGNLQITAGDQPLAQLNTNRLRSLLAFLVLHTDNPPTREQLAFQLWPESSESQARTNLRQLLHHMRRALPADCSLLEMTSQTVRWRRDPSCIIDVVEFASAIARASAAGRRNDSETEVESLETASCLYQDDLARGLYDEWLQPKRDHYRQQFEAALVRLSNLYEQRRDYPAAIRHTERLVTHDPIREAHHQRLIHLHIAHHDRASALRAYHQCLRTLRRELGVDPCRETRDLFDRALKSMPAATAPGHPDAPAHRAPVIVGRKQEWQTLTECWRLTAPGRTQMVVLQGEPGIGKSRLADELYDWCLQRGESAARTRCYAAQGQLAYAPIAGWLRADPLRTALSGLAPSQLTELARVLPEILAENASIRRPGPLAESWERHHFYESLNAMFHKAARPLLLLIDDLQWCDQDSFEWMHGLFRSESSAGILLVATLRLEETGREHPYHRLRGELARTGQIREVPLQLLTLEETADLAAGLTEHPLAPSDAARLFRTTQGNPLFVLETVRAGLPNAYAEAPPKIYAVIATRLAQLSPQAHELAGLAGTIGQAFTFDLLVKATDWDEDSVSRALDELWQRRIVSADPHNLDGYDFTHDRLREVAYAELSPVRRRFLHRRVARALEELHASDISGVSGQLAAHYDAAGMAEPAIRYYRQAAAVARGRYADAEAAGLLRRALAICRELPQNAVRDAQELDLIIELGLPLVTTQGYAMPEVGEIYARALALSDRLRDHRHTLPLLTGTWVYHVVRGNLETCRELARQILSLPDREEPEPVTISGNFITGSTHFHLGLLRSSEEHFRTAFASVNRSRTAWNLFLGPDIRVFCQAYLANVLELAGKHEESLALSRGAISDAQALSHPFSVVLALNYSAMMYLLRGQSREVLRHAEDSATVSRKYDFAYYLPMAEILAGWAIAMEGDPEAGTARLRQGIDSLKSTYAELRLPLYHGLLAEACAAAGRFSEGLANISIGLAFQNKNHEIWAAPNLYRIEGDILLQTGHPEHAADSYRRSMEAAREIGALSYELRAGKCLQSLQRPGATAARS